MGDIYLQCYCEGGTRGAIDWCCVKKFKEARKRYEEWVDDIPEIVPMAEMKELKEWLKRMPR